jgi:4-amino-4-deoxy-L-arabinose transferase-like glycosyltransferase
VRLRTRAPRGRLLSLVVVAVVAAGFMSLGVSEAWSDSPTYDEPVYVAAGLAAVLHHDVSFNDEHPPLPKILAVLPVLLVHPAVPGNGSWSANDEQAYSPRFVRAQIAHGSLRRVTFASRLIPLAESAATAFAIWALGAELFGAAAGACAGVAWLASPFVLGIGHLDGTDVPFALAVTLSSWALARWHRLRTTRALVWAGLAAGGAAAAEISGLLVVLASLAVITVLSWRSGVAQAARKALLAGIAALFVIWLPYVLVNPAATAGPAVLLPRPYADGIGYLYHHDEIPAPGYVDGIRYNGGRLWFWPISLGVKLPAALLVLLVAGSVSWLWLERSVRRRALLTVALPAFLLAAFTMATPEDIGLRYLLPVIALWTAGAAAIVHQATVMPRPARLAIRAGSAGLLAAAALSTGLSFPTSLAWTAPPFRPGYAVATNSDVDWGQGLYSLTAWARGRRLWFSYFGPLGITAADVPGARPLPATAPAGVSGWVAVSATNLTSEDSPELGWLRDYCPVGVLAGSMLIYHFARPPEDASALAPARPALPCPGEWSRRTAS